ncbi:RNA polymerase sigma factor SigX [Tumebacillus lipolyticus]|uniref:RNA polymerase sigma factor SigX n=1 Tax=Tumebacillus lipolyticus TaxID=1280370 RepID=A0ABW4ZY12_9BACL
MEGIARMAERPSSHTAPPFPELFKTYYPQVVRQIMRITRDQSAAEDLAQEVFLKLYDQDIRLIENIGGWLMQAGIYAAYNYLRGEKRRNARDEEQAHHSSQVEPSPEDRWLHQEEIEAVREAIFSLPERDRTLLMMKYSGYNYKELAEATSVDTGSVGTLLARARRKFRDLYQRKRGSEA